MSARDGVTFGYLRAGIALLVLAALFAGGYYAYVHVGGPLFAQTHSSATLPPALLLALALVGGAASFFSPCSLAITPSFLIYFIESGPGVNGDSAANRRRFLSGSAVVALGIIAFYALAGALVSWIGAIAYNLLVYLIPLVGVAFLGLGILILLGRGHALGWLGRFNPVQPYYDQVLEHPAPKNGPALFGFGAAYGAASHTCTLPIFLGIVLIPLAAGDYGLAAVAVALYGAAIAALLILMAYLGQGVLLAVRRAAGRYLQYATGGLFIFTAVYLFHYFAVNFGLSF